MSGILFAAMKMKKRKSYSFLAILNASFYLLITVQRTPIQYCVVKQLHKSSIKQQHMR
jgi:hypothetical protein